MKNLLFLLLFTFSITSCTDNQRARTFGGKETITLPKGQKLVNATWKEDDLWYLTEPMAEGYVPQTRSFKEKSSFGALEGEILFYESR